MPPPPSTTAALAPSLTPRHGCSFSSPPRCSFCAEPRWSATWPMINTTGCRSKSSPSGGAIVPIQGHARQRHLGPGGPPCGGVTKGVALGSRVRGGGRDAGFAAIVPGRMRQFHRRPDAESHGPGPAPVGGMARQPPAPCGRDKDCHCWPATAGPLSRLQPGEPSCWATVWSWGAHFLPTASRGG
jgi:hypothetical protein